MVAGKVERPIELIRQSRQYPIVGDGPEPEIDFGRLRQVADIRRQQVVDNHDAPRPHGQQQADQVTADKAGAPDHEDRAAGESGGAHRSAMLAASGCRR